MNRPALAKVFALITCLFSASVLADGQGPITDMHYAIWDNDQTSATCFEVGGVALAFISNGSEKHKVIAALLVTAFVTGKTISYQASASALNPAPCQSWEFPTTVYQVYAIAFQP
jgi:hypothetical protein